MNPGYKLVGNKILIAESKTEVMDFSITKNVLMLFINASLLAIGLLAVANAYKSRVSKAPSGLQSFIEPIILFVLNDIVKPNIGPKYEKYLPYLTFFLVFILVIVLMILLAKLLEGILKTISLNVFNKIAGAVFGIIKFALVRAEN